MTKREFFKEGSVNDAPPKCERPDVICTYGLSKTPVPTESLVELEYQIGLLRTRKDELEAELREVNDQLSELHLKRIRKQLESVTVTKVYTDSERRKLERIAKGLGVSVEKLQRVMEEAR